MNIEAWTRDDGERSENDPVVRLVADDGSLVVALFADEVAGLVEWAAKHGVEIVEVES